MASMKKAKRKRSESTLPCLDTLFKQDEKRRKCTKDLVEHFEALSVVELNSADLSQLEIIPEDAKICWLFAKYSVETIMKVCRCESLFPVGMTETQRNENMASQTGVPVQVVSFLQEFIREQCPSLLTAVMGSSCDLILGPPTASCYECGSDLVQYHQCSVKCYSTQGFQVAQKVTLRCKECKLLYNYGQFGNKRELGFRFYPDARDYVEAKDTVFVHRQLLELQCNLANHSWVSFQGFAESFNDTFELSSEQELTAHLAAEAFYNGELESELRQNGVIEYRFRLDSDREECMNILESKRRESVYPHGDCSRDCKKRGCGHLWITDGIWKTTFPHCMFKVENCVGAIPNLNLPDVCTASPQHGQAFCKEHCLLVQKEATGVPTGLRDFLKYCGSLKVTEDEEASEANAQKVDKAVNTLLVATNNVGESSSYSQGIAPLIANHPTLLHDMAIIDESDKLCRKDTGKGKRLRNWSRGHQFIVRGGGHIDTWQPLNRSESPSQVFLVLLQWLITLVQRPSPPSEVILAYDNMCNLAKLKAARNLLPLPPPLADVWRKVIKIIGTFHFKNHISPKCREEFSPHKVKSDHPDYNTQAGEQTFVWVGRFRHILCSMNKTHHLFYLHRMVQRRNKYTAKCYRNGKEPILPKSSRHPFVPTSQPQIDLED